MIPALISLCFWSAVLVQQPAPWLRGWNKALQAAGHSHVHVLVFSDSTARVDQTNGVGFGPDRRANLWPEQLQTTLENDIPLQSGSHGILTLEANAARFDTDIWSVSSRYAFNSSIGPYEAELDHGQVPSNGSTVTLRAGERAVLSPRPGDTLWIYWASCPESGSFTVAVDDKTIGTFGDRSATSCVARRTCVFRGSPGEHQFTITAGHGDVYLYAAEWTTGKRGVSVDNFSIGGATSDFFAGPSKLSYVRLVPDVALAIIALGINDFLHSVPPKRYRFNLKAIITNIRQQFPAASILILNQYPVLSDDHRNVLGLTQSTYDRSAQEVASEQRTGYLNLSQSWGSVRNAQANGLLTRDLVHPSDAGRRQISCELERAILPSREIQCAGLSRPDASGGR